MSGRQGSSGRRPKGRAEPESAFQRLQSRGEQLLDWFPELRKTILREGEPGLEAVLGQLQELTGLVSKRAQETSRDLEARAEQVFSEIEHQAVRGLRPLLSRANVVSREDVAHLDERLGTLEKQLGALTEERSAARTRTGDLTSEVETVRQTLAEQRIETSERLRELQLRMAEDDGLRGEFAGLREHLDALSKEHVTHTLESGKREDRTLRLEMRLGDLLREHTNLQAERKTELDALRQALEAGTGGAATVRDGLHETVDALAARLEALQVVRQEDRQTIDSLRAALDDTRTRGLADREDLRSQIEALHQALTRHPDERDLVRAELQALHRALDDARASHLGEREELRRQIEALHRMFDEAGHNLRGDGEAVRQQIDSLRHLVEETTAVRATGDEAMNGRLDALRRALDASAAGQASAHETSRSQLESLRRSLEAAEDRHAADSESTRKLVETLAQALEDLHLAVAADRKAASDRIETFGRALEDLKTGEVSDRHDERERIEGLGRAVDNLRATQAAGGNDAEREQIEALAQGLEEIRVGRVRESEAVRDEMDALRRGLDDVVTRLRSEALRAAAPLAHAAPNDQIPPHDRGDLTTLTHGLEDLGRTMRQVDLRIGDLTERHVSLRDELASMTARLGRLELMLAGGARPHFEGH